MKKLLLLPVFIFIAGASQAQQLKSSDVPASVKNAFSKLFPAATDVKWSKESATEFEAEFKVNKINKSSNFDPAGKWLGTETVIRQSDLPPAVKASITKDFPGYKMEEVELAETPDKGSFYEMELEKGESNVEVQVSTAGKILKKEEIKEKD